MNTYQQNALTCKHKLVQVKDSAPYTAAKESQVYLDPTARAEYDPMVKTWKFSSWTSKAQILFLQSKRARKERSPSTKAADAQTELSTDESATLQSALSQHIDLATKSIGVGVDVEPVATFESLGGRKDFIRRNFTRKWHIATAPLTPRPVLPVTGLPRKPWSKLRPAPHHETNVWKGASAPLRKIEIVMTAPDSPSVLHSGYPLEVFRNIGLASLGVFISCSGAYTVSQAIANFQV